ncbi:hypothetical protein ACF0H5_002716 [Mactra antiquata]
MAKKDDGTDSEFSHTQEATIMELKMRKTRNKTKFTRLKNKLKDCITDKNMTVSEIRDMGKELLDKVEGEMDEVVESLNVLALEYKNQERTKEMALTMKEIDTIEESYNEIVSEFQKVISKKESSSSESETSEDEESTDKLKGAKKQLDNDLKSQMKRVQIPEFSGKKKDYPFWKAAFSACIDSTDSSGEYKFLQMRQYLKGEALEAIQGLGHTTIAYEKAKERLDRKYGGKRRLISKFLDEISEFPTIKNENSNIVEKFADLLDIAIINIQENDIEDMQSGYMYQQLLKKLPETMIIRYQRHLFEKGLSESVEQLSQWINKESEFMTIAHEARNGLEEKSDKSTQQNKKRPNTYTHFQDNKTTQGNVKYTPVCKMCSSKDHEIYRCSKFKQLYPEQRWEKAKQLNLCFRCLGSGHTGSKCNKMKQCGINDCKKNHNRLLHSEKTENLQSTAEQPGSPHQSSNRNYHQSTSTNMKVALRTVPVIVKHKDKKMTINALLDDGSSKTYINSDVAAELGLDLTVNSHTMTVNVMNGKQEKFETTPVNFLLESVNGQIKVSVEATTVEHVTGNLQTIDWNKHSHKFKHLQGLAFPKVRNKDTVDMLIGVDYANLHCALHEITGEPGEPVARLTPLGWTCVGPIESQNDSTFNTYFQNDMKLEKTVERFWELENIPAPEKLCTLEDDKTMKFVENSIKIEDSGKYQVSIPWNGRKIELNNTCNYESALKRLRNTEKKLAKNETVKSEYESTIQKYLKKGYISKVNDNEINNESPAWYLPHFPVTKMDRETTKVRIVFDAAAKHNNICLNDAVKPGPKLQNELFDVLLRFRKEQVGIICDIEEMYMRVGICPTDRPYHRFLLNSDEPTCYQFNSLVFGVNASPFLAQFVARKNAELYKNEFPRASEVVLKSTYMDDSMDSVATPEDGIELYHHLSELWSKASMFARKWLSNSPEVVNSIPAENRASKVELHKNELPTVKTLGVTWLSNEDCFTFNSRKPDENYLKLTKRIILKKIASIFDPHGFISPYIIRAKTLMQDLWLAGLDWDELVPMEIAQSFRAWYNELSELECIRVPRCICPVSYSSVKNLTLHAFGDASEKAYGAVIYARCENENYDISVRFVASKSKVAPVKTVSIPRLELLAAVLCMKLTLAICTALDINIENCTLWTDSMNVLHWIKNRSSLFKPFVANRVGEIQQATKPVQWRHVKGINNPADIVSRGSSVQNLKDNDMWWNGPEFLLEDESKWPNVNIEQISSNDSEIRKSQLNKLEFQTFFVKHQFHDTVNEDFRLHPKNYSNWRKLVHVYAWVKRFMENCKRPKPERISGELDVSEVHDAEVVIIINCQKTSFTDEYKCLLNKKAISNKSKIIKLNPKIDIEGLLRCEGRLMFAEFVSYDCRYPIILPRNSFVTELIVKHYHEKGKHSGTNYTLSLLSTHYWIIAAREVIREVEKNCSTCRRNKAKPSEQIMAPLPAARTGMPMRAFAHTAVDYGGPFETIQGRGKVREKRYLCLFTCLATRAVHLEMAYKLDTSSFLNAFYRFVSRRGLPVKMRSDNGSNFVGANRELKELVNALDTSEIKRRTVDNGIQWDFNPPSAPHWGGAHEIMIKAAKRAIFAILHSADIRDEELMTAFIGAESLINSRPLTYQSANPSDIVPLTPNHFLFGQIGGEFAPESVDYTKFDPRNRWRRVQELMRHFWHRWLKEWLPTLSARKRWFSVQRDLQPNDVVIVVQPDTPRGRWPLGRILRVHQGQDGRVRVADVLMNGKEITRPISRLCPLEVQE